MLHALIPRPVTLVARCVLIREKLKSAIEVRGSHAQLDKAMWFWLIAVVQAARQGVENKLKCSSSGHRVVESRPCDQQSTAVSSPQTPCKNNYSQRIETMQTILWSVLPLVGGWTYTSRWADSCTSLGVLVDGHCQCYLVCENICSSRWFPGYLVTNSPMAHQQTRQRLNIFHSSHCSSGWFLAMRLLLRCC